MMTEAEKAELAGDPDWCANYDYNDIPGLLAEIRRLRAIAEAAAAHRAAYLAWHNWRPCAGMGHGYADRYAATRDALWAALTPPEEGQ